LFPAGDRCNPSSTAPEGNHGDHDTFSAYYHNLMYAGLRTSDTLRKKPCRIGPGLCETSMRRHFLSRPTCRPPRGRAQQLCVLCAMLASAVNTLRWLRATPRRGLTHLSEGPMCLACEYPLDLFGHAPTAPSSPPTLRRPTPIRLTGPSFTMQLSFEGARPLRPQPLLGTSSLRRVGL
jgi:hypothetical protein